MKPIHRLDEREWHRVAEIQRKSFTGGSLTAAESQLVQAAFAVDPDRYSESGRKVRAEEIARIRRGGV